MTNRASKGTAVLVALVFGLSISAHAAKNEWDRIDLQGPIDVTLSDGTTRTLEPSCSGGPKPVLDGDGNPTGAIERANEDFFFFVQKGNPNKLLVGLDGGGACWDGLTCIGSPLGVLGPGQGSTYTQELDETVESLAQAGGVFDARNPENPFGEYTKIFIPYCSADIHWGSKDTTYFFPGPGGLIEWEIHHRGSDNFLAVLDWLKKNGRAAYNIDFDRARDVMVTGASAGGYGATIVFPYVAELTPRARLNLVSDAAIGVINTSLFQTAIYDPATGTANWGIEKNLPPMLASFGLDEDALAARATSGNPSGLTRDVFKATAAYQPDAKLASLTTNLDLVQVSFYALARLGDGASPEQIAQDWYLTMATETALTAAEVPNYRYFIQDGTFHTFIGSDLRTYGPGAEGVPLAEWLRAMTKPGNRTWENLDDGPPQLP